MNATFKLSYSVLLYYYISSLENDYLLLLENSITYQHKDISHLSERFLVHLSGKFVPKIG